ncbi:hypothetical protein V6Z11_D05G255300 [Gossypium hirsutum]
MARVATTFRPLHFFFLGTERLRLHYYFKLVNNSGGGHGSNFLWSLFLRQADTRLDPYRQATQTKHRSAKRKRNEGGRPRERAKTPLRKTPLLQGEEEKQNILESLVTCLNHNLCGPNQIHKCFKTWCMPTCGNPQH